MFSEVVAIYEEGVTAGFSDAELVLSVVHEISHNYFGELGN